MKFNSGSFLNLNTQGSNYLSASTSSLYPEFEYDFVSKGNQFLDQQNFQLSLTHPELAQSLKTQQTVFNFNKSMDDTIQNAKNAKLSDFTQTPNTNSETTNKKYAEIKSNGISGNFNLGGIAKAARGTLDFAAQAGGFEKNDTMDGIYDTASDIAAQFGPWGMLAAGIIDTWNFIDKAGGKDIKGFNGQTGSSSYTDFTVQDKRLRMTQRGAAKQNEALRDSKLFQFSKAMGAVDSNRQLVQARTQAADNMNRSFLNKKAGGVSGSLLTAKNGGVLKEIKSVISKHNRELILDKNFFKEKPQESSDIKMFKDGGAVIPSGALHKNKHHLESIDPNLKQNITTKGIPVITIEEGGEIKQHAEIEKEEVILSLSLTKQIEQLWKEGTDEAAIEAGKLLTEALLRDTEDNVGLIEKIENESKG